MYNIIFPKNIEDYEWELSSKGYFSETEFIHEDRIYKISFYDPVRLSQEIEDALLKGEAFLDKNTVVIQEVSMVNMKRAIEEIISSKKLDYLVPEN